MRPRPGITEVKAQALIDYREQEGAFQRTDELLKVTESYSVTYERLSELVTVGGQPMRLMVAQVPPKPNVGAVYPVVEDTCRTSQYVHELSEISSIPPRLGAIQVDLAIPIHEAWIS